MESAGYSEPDPPPACWVARKVADAEDADREAGMSVSVVVDAAVAR